MRPKPILTLTAVGVATIAAVIQYTVPSAVPVLQRAPGTPEATQWWRLVTPLLVQTLGWYQVVTNLVTLALVGIVAERELGRWRWLLLFIAGTIGGQLAAYLQHEPGGGDSIAICGLAGGTVIHLLARRPHPTHPPDPRATAKPSPKGGAGGRSPPCLGAWGASPTKTTRAPGLRCPQTWGSRGRVEVPGIEPGSSVALPGLLRVQSAVSLLGPTVHADETV